MSAAKLSKLRADQLLVELGACERPEEAQALIMAGRVMLTDPTGRERKVHKPGEPWPRGSTLRLLGESKAFVSRAGRKLEAALERFAIDPAGRTCADFGISTGGFTDCLLQRGAAKVHGVDVAYGMLAWRIRQDPRVVVHERTNVRTLPPLFFGERVSLAVVDLSFISLVAVLPAICGQLEPGAEVVALVKPQFELSRGEAPGGLVQDDALRDRAVAAVSAAAGALGLEARGALPSPLPGADGNVERLLHLRWSGGGG